MPPDAPAQNKHIIEEFVYVGVPHQVVYDQWTQYHDWPKILKNESAEPKSGEQHGDNGDGENNELNVRSKIGPSERQWEAEIIGQRPGRRIEWQAKGGVQAKGVVTFHRLDERLTHLQVVIQYVPSGFMETVGNFLRMPRRRVRKDLRLFKNFIELRGQASGQGPGPVGGNGLREDMDSELQGGDDEEGSE